jgi:hypothetical protein
MSQRDRAEGQSGQLRVACAPTCQAATVWIQLCSLRRINSSTPLHFCTGRPRPPAHVAPATAQSPTGAFPAAASHGPPARPTPLERHRASVSIKSRSGTPPARPTRSAKAVDSSTPFFLLLPSLGGALQHVVYLRLHLLVGEAGAKRALALRGARALRGGGGGGAGGGGPGGGRAPRPRRGGVHGGAACTACTACRRCKPGAERQAHASRAEARVRAHALAAAATARPGPARLGSGRRRLAFGAQSWPKPGILPFPLYMISYSASGVARPLRCGVKGAREGAGAARSPRRARRPRLERGAASRGGGACARRLSRPLSRRSPPPS